MRVIAGRFKGRRLRAPARGVRPSSDRLRERLFAILGGSFAGGLAVDLFCGAGTLGIEAVSRGAERLCCVDRDREHLQVLEANLAPLRAAGIPVSVVREDACRYVEERWPQEEAHWVFLDPPYGDAAGPRCLAALGRLHAERLGWVIFEGAELVEPVEGLARARTVVSGGSCITFMRGALAP